MGLMAALPFFGIPEVKQPKVERDDYCVYVEQYQNGIVRWTRTTSGDFARSFIRYEDTNGSS